MSKTTTKTKTRSVALSEGLKGEARKAGRNHGQWKQSNTDEDESNVGFVHLSSKVRPEEKEAFKALCKSQGVTPNKAVRIFVRQPTGYLELGDQSLECLLDITRQISGVSRNINQIAKAGNRTLSPDYVAFMEDRKELGAQLARLEDLLREVVNVGKRRSDGLSKFEDLLEAE